MTSDTTAVDDEDRRQVSYADAVRHPPRVQSTPVLGTPKARLPMSQLTLGRTTPPWYAHSWKATGGCGAATEDDEEVLRVEFPRGESCPCAFRARPRCLPATDVTLHYRVKFAPNFEWAPGGGRLPGLAVGCAEGSTAATCHVSWHVGGGVTLDVFTDLPQPAALARGAKRLKYGYELFKKSKLYVLHDSWNDIIVRVKLNSVAGGEPEADGAASLVVNGRADAINGIVWRTRRGCAVSQLLWSAKYRWKSLTNTHALFSDVYLVS